ncbi:TPA: hypothetical protein VAV28_000688 [Streptococcus agalactiae]|nr:hypothetical protein [Streptococcus agalactiae]
MGKPLLTDDMIERSNRGEKVSGQTILDQETKIISTEDGMEQLTDENGKHIYKNKSRRIENAKRNEFQRKLNLVLFILLILLALLFYAIFKL